jgi:hypothetical protein
LGRGSFLSARSTKYTPLRSLLWWSVDSISSSSKVMTQLSMWATPGSTLAGSTLDLRQWASTASVRAVRRFTCKICRSHMLSRASKYLDMATTVGSSSWAPKFSKVRTLASQAGRLWSMESTSWGWVPDIIHTSS